MFLVSQHEHTFPNRRRREIVRDPLTGQNYESYEANVEQIGDVPLINDTMARKGDNNITIDDEEDEFDDQFEEDLLDKKMMEDFLRQQQEVDNDVEKSDDLDLSSSRWVAYDALSALLER